MLFNYKYLLLSALAITQLIHPSEDNCNLQATLTVAAASFSGGIASLGIQKLICKAGMHHAKKEQQRNSNELAVKIHDLNQSIYLIDQENLNFHAQHITEQLPLNHPLPKQLVHHISTFSVRPTEALRNVLVQRQAQLIAEKSNWDDIFQTIENNHNRMTKYTFRFSAVTVILVGTAWTVLSSGCI